jgi:putative transposase
MLHRQLGREKVRFAPPDRVFLAALLHQFPPKVLRKLRLLVRPAPERACSTWAEFLRSPAHALLACDFFKTVTLSGARMYVFAVIEHAHRRIRVLGATAHPTAAWVIQAAKNLVMDVEDTGCRPRFMIRARNGKFPTLFDAVLADAGIDVVLSGVRMRRMKSIMER